MKPVVHTPHPVLTTPAKPVTTIDAKIKRIVKDMRETLIAANNPIGVGLAAPQIGVSLRIFLIRPDEKDNPRVFINPEITTRSETVYKGIPGKKGKLEGCLSIPKVWGVVNRHQRVTLSFLDENGKKQTAKFTGFASIIIQHEIDHLDGILFPRRVLEQKGHLYTSTKDDTGKEILEPLEI